MVTIIHHDGTHQTIYPGEIPDLWHLAMWLQGNSDVIMDGDERARWGDMVLTTWHLCHELFRALQELQTNQEVKP